LQAQLKGSITSSLTRPLASLFQGLFAFIGGLASIVQLVFPTYALLSVVLLMAILVIWIGHSFSIAKPALIAGFIGGGIALLAILLYAFTAFIATGPP
jgi:hypothetical protein